MAGKRPIPFPAALHIMCRGNNRHEILYSDRDKAEYYALLLKYKDENNIAIFHYCIMLNHAHLIVWLKELSNISRFMKQVNLTYFNYYKDIREYTGHLWQGRFKSKVIDNDPYLLQCGKYIELNPVRKGLVTSPEEYAYSSYNYYANGRSDPLLTPDPLYLGLHVSEKKRKELYRSITLEENIDLDPSQENVSPR